MPMRAPRCLGLSRGADQCRAKAVSWLSRDRHHRLRRRAEQQVVDDSFVLEGDVGDLGRQTEDDVEVADRQQVGLAFRQPGARSSTLALRAVPVAATVVGDALMAAVLAGLDMTARSRRAARLDRRHDLELRQAQLPGIGGPISGAGSPEDIGDLE